MPRHYEVRITEGMSFDPPQMEIAVGDSVTWINDDEQDHTVSVARSREFAGDLTQPELEFVDGEVSPRVVFCYPGRFAYECRLYPTMTGVIEVVEATD